MLRVEALNAYYGKSHVLRGVSFEVHSGEIVALLGRNGSGRSTTAKALMGLVQWQGLVQFNAQDLTGKQPFEIARLGLGYVPESRDVFPQLTVHQNLLLGRQKGKTDGFAFDDAYAMFPRLQARQHVFAGLLSGGEQQMLSLCRTLMGNPQLIIVDEPTEGLAPQVVEQVAEALVAIQQRGMSVLLIEQKLNIALRISNRVLVMGHGEIVLDGTPDALLGNVAIRREWLEV